MCTLETERLILRPFCQADIDVYAEMCADREVMRFIGEGGILSREEAWRNMAMVVGHWQLRGYGLWAVELKETNQLIGRVGSWNPEGWPGFEIGWLLHRKHWGNGYATEAGRATMDHAFGELHQSEVISLIQPANTASIRVAERLGEQHHGTTMLLGKKVLVYRLLRDEWESRKTDHGKSV